jgi:type IV pilus modification protein PilV
VEPRNDSRRREAGFTLIEVLIAMVILSVGLLALEGMAVGSAKVTASANRRSRYAEVATDTLERVLSRLAEGQAVSSSSSFYVTNTSGSNTAQATVTVTDGGTLSAPSPANHRYDVSVRVIPTVSTRLADSVNLSASVIH